MIEQEATIDKPEEKKHKAIKEDIPLFCHFCLWLIIPLIMY